MKLFLVLFLDNLYKEHHELFKNSNSTEFPILVKLIATSADLSVQIHPDDEYAAKNENMSPIVATSIKAVVGSEDVPMDYTTGIHMFGSDAAYNLNNTQLVWNNKAPSVFVYFNVDTGVAQPTTAGSSFSPGYMVLFGVLGLLAGIGIGALITLSVKKKKVGMTNA